MSTIGDHRSVIGSHGRRQSMGPKKVTFKLPSNLKGAFLDFTKGHDHRPYQELVVLLRDSEVKDEDLCKLLGEAQDCVSLMDQNLRLFIQVLLVFKWAHRGPDAVAAFQNFLLNLCSAHNYHTKAVLEHLAKYFSLGVSDGESDDFPDAEETKIFRNVHHVLDKLLRVVPMAGDLMVRAVSDSFPFFKQSPRKLLSHVHNTLEILKYAPKYKNDFLHIILNNMIQLDVNAPRSAIEDAEDEDEMDVDCTVMFQNGGQGMKLLPAESLDRLMIKLFSYIKEECTDPSTGETSLKKCSKVYTQFFPVFEKQILPTHNTHHVQYVMWYICSLRPQLAEVFVKQLWQLVTGVHYPPVMRQSASAYVSSILARAKFVKLEYVKVVIQDMSDWIHSYINNQDGQKVVEIRLHTVFYCVCQGLFYLLCFKHKELFATKQNVAFLKSLNLTKVITSTLNPLRVCLPEIVQRFAAITRAYQLVYCNSVLERNARSNVPVVHSRQGVLHADQPAACLDTFFPFDPYVLKKSSSFIIKDYNIFQEDDTMEESNQKLNKADNDEDDFLAEPMSVSLNDKRFSYGSSPGFLHEYPLGSSSSPRWRSQV